MSDLVDSHSTEQTDVSVDVRWIRFVRSWRAIGKEAIKAWRWSPERLCDLTTRHPLPWHVDQDWTFEVIASDGQCVGQFMLASDADEFIREAVAIRGAMEKAEPSGGPES